MSNSHPHAFAQSFLNDVLCPQKVCALLVDTPDETTVLFREVDLGAHVVNTLNVAYASALPCRFTVAYGCSITQNAYTPTKYVKTKSLSPFQLVRLLRILQLTEETET